MGIQKRTAWRGEEGLKRSLQRMENKNSLEEKTGKGISGRERHKGMQA